MSGRDHVLELPRFIFIVRCVQAGIALVVLGLSAYAVSQLPVDGADLAVYAALSALIVTVYMIVAELSFPVIYNYWAFMALDIYQLIIWLVAMAITATDISDINHAVNLINSYASGAGINSGSSSGSGSDCYDGYCFTSGKVKRQEGQDIPSYGFGDYGNYGKLDSISKAKTYRGIVGAIAGISGLEMVLFGVTLAFVVMALLAHRRAGGHCTPRSGAISRERKANPDVEQQYEPMRHQQEAYPPVQPPQQHGANETHYASMQPPQPYASPEPQHAPMQPPQPYPSPEPQYPHVQPPAQY